jgi:hypothetical protein
MVNYTEWTPNLGSGKDCSQSGTIQGDPLYLWYQAFNGSIAVDVDTAANRYIIFAGIKDLLSSCAFTGSGTFSSRMLVTTRPNAQMAVSVPYNSEVQTWEADCDFDS